MAHIMTISFLSNVQFGLLLYLYSKAAVKITYFKSTH